MPEEHPLRHISREELLVKLEEAKRALANSQREALSVAISFALWWLIGVAVSSLFLHFVGVWQADMSHRLWLLALAGLLVGAYPVPTLVLREPKRHLRRIERFLASTRNLFPWPLPDEHWEA